MSWTLGEQSVFLHRPGLKGIHRRALPAGYEELRATDELTPRWVELLDSVFGGFSAADPPLVRSPRWRSDRVKLVAKGGVLVAVCVGWDEPSLWPRSGQVFFTAVAEEHRCRGLGAFVVAQLLMEFDHEGLADAVVDTEVYRLPAIRLYMKLGFEPLITELAQDERWRWHRVFTAMGRPELMSSVRDDYARITAGHSENSGSG